MIFNCAFSFVYYGIAGLVLLRWNTITPAQATLSVLMVAGGKDVWNHLLPILVGNFYYFLASNYFEHLDSGNKQDLAKWQYLKSKLDAAKGILLNCQIRRLNSYSWVDTLKDGEDKGSLAIMHD